MTLNPNMGGPELKVVYVLRRAEDRGPFLELMSELRTVTTHLMKCAGAKGCDYAMSERPDRPGWFAEVLRFGNEKQLNKFDELYCQDRKASALQALLDNLVDDARSDYVLTRGDAAGAVAAHPGD